MLSFQFGTYFIFFSLIYLISYEIKFDLGSMFSLLVNIRIFIVILLAGEVMGSLGRKEYQKMLGLLIIKYHLSFFNFHNYVLLGASRKKDFHHQLSHERNYSIREPLKSLALYFQFYHYCSNFIFFVIFTFYLIIN